jgi:hypothetical protein
VRDARSNGRELFGRAAEAVEQIRTLRRADGPLLEPVLAAVLGETARNRFRAAGMLATLTAEFADARAAVAALAADARAHVRRRAMRCLGHDTPRAFASQILQAGLVDADPGVRMKAASVAGLLGLSDLLAAASPGKPAAAADRLRE